MEHLVITIGCEYGAKGNQIGKKVAQDLGIKFYDRETVDEIIKEVGIENFDGEVFLGGIFRHSYLETDNKEDFREGLRLSLIHISEPTRPY